MARVDSGNGQRITIKIMITITTKNGRVSREAVNGYFRTYFRITGVSPFGKSRGRVFRVWAIALNEFPSRCRPEQNLLKMLDGDVDAVRMGR